MIASDTMRNENSDVATAVAFVTMRIKEQAIRSGEPLDVDEQFSLAHLPLEWFSATSANGPSPELPAFAIRNPTLERFCKLTEDAHNDDLAANPETARDWEFAAAALNLASHPFSRLLQAVGIKERRQRWDRWLLIVAGLLVVILGLGVNLLFDLTGNQSSTVNACVCVLVFALSCFAWWRFDNWQLKQSIETSRRPTRRSPSRGRFR
jgi:hypothetical protein